MNAQRLNVKIKMPKNIVQVLRTFDLEDANNECINAARKPWHRRHFQQDPKTNTLPNPILSPHQPRAIPIVRKIQATKTNFISSSHCNSKSPFNKYAEIKLKKLQINIS